MRFSSSSRSMVLGVVLSVVSTGTLFAVGCGARGARDERVSTVASAEPRSSTSTEFSIATYNVQGFGDDVGAGFPWEFSDQSSNWIKDKMYQAKGKNIAEALALAGTPDIVALQEIKYIDGSGRSLETLWPYLQELGYKYKALGPQRKRPPNDRFPSDTQAIISRFPILEIEGIPFEAEERTGAARDPLAVTIDVAGSKLRVYTLHAKSKFGEKTPEDAQLGAQLRKAMSEVVQQDIATQRELDGNIDVVVLGDFNANYYEASLTEGLGSTGDEQKMVATGNGESALYNLWYEMAPEDRCNLSSGGVRGCIDNILVSSSLYDKNGIQYVDNSLRIVGIHGVARRKLMSPTGTGFRWATRETLTADPVSGKTKKFTTHLGVGYSDHFPIVASFIVVGNTGDVGRMELASAPSPEVNHQEGTLFDRVPFCTDGMGNFLPGEQVIDLVPELDLSQSSYWNRCFRLDNMRIPLKIVDRYDVRVDYGFEFKTESPFFNTLSVSIQWDDRSPAGKIKDRAGKMSSFVNTVQPALDAGKTVYLVGVKGRLGVSFGKVTILAEDAPVLLVE
jgi:endonuclease/exonuclease/phosphatase family metal-dependent hydrolase